MPNFRTKVHYGMPVKDGLYDMLGYSKRIAEINRSYRKDSDHSDDEGELTVENDVIKIKLTSEEFLSGLRKGDKLMPIITAVVYLGEKPWDGPRSLFDMLDVQDERLYRFLNDYKLNLISHADMADEELQKFHTDLGFAMINQSKYNYALFACFETEKLLGEGERFTFAR